MLNKKAESETLSLEFLIGLIVAVMLIAVVIGVGYKYMKVDQNTQESFEELYTKISEIKDLETDSMVLSLHEEKFIFIFETTEYEIKSLGTTIYAPNTCSSLPCICLCEKSNDRNEILCAEGICYNFEFKEPTQFVGSGSPVIITGTDAEAGSIFIKKEANTIFISNSKDFVPTDVQEEVTEAKVNVAGLTSALSKEIECKYTLDTEFFKDNDYILHFTETTVEITDFDGNIYSTEESSFNFINAIADDFYIYVVEEDSGVQSQYVSVINTVMYMSDSLEFQNKEKISNELKIKDNTIEFLESSSDLDECSELIF